MNETSGYNPSCHSYRTSAQMLHQLLTSMSRKGNLLLEVSPDGHGRIPAEQLDRLCGIGRWIRANEQVVYRGRRAEINVPGLGWSLEAQGRTYIIPHRWYGETLTFGWCGRAVQSAKVLATGTPARVEQRGDRVWLPGLPPDAPDPYATVVEIMVA